MSTTFDIAGDEIKNQFLQAWLGAAEIVGSIPPIEWQGVESDAPPDGSFYWARLSKQTVGEEQDTLSDCEQAPGQKSYEVFGLVFVQIFAPKHLNGAYKNAEKLAKLAQSAYRGRQTESGVWFRNVRINELEPEKDYYRFNVVAEFEYNEIS